MKGWVNMTFEISRERIQSGMETMNGFGLRLTGSSGQQRFVDYLKDEIHKMGFKTYSDLYSFDRWEEKHSSIKIINSNGDEEIEVTSAWPYSGETDENGITEEIVEIFGKHINYLPARGKIALVKVKDLEKVPTGFAFNQRNSYPTGLSLPKNYKGPVADSFVKIPLISVAKAMGVKAVICIWEGMSDEMVKGQYLPFIMDYQGIPALWVGEESGEKLKKAAKEKKKVNLVLTAEKENNATTESFYTVIEGKNKKEAIIINTHTDGINCVEENGSIAMLEMMRHLKDMKLDRTLIFVFVTGHFRLPNFKQHDIQASSKWLKNHRDMWDGKKGHIKAVASLGVEHLGCTEWKDKDGKYQCTNPIDVELVYTANNAMDKVYYDSLEGRIMVRTVTVKGHNFLHFGEGQPPRNVGIPDISLVTAPDYLTAINETHQMEKFSLDLMCEQIETFLKMTLTLDKMSADEIGKPEPYSLILGKIK